MAESTTTNYSWTKPEVGASEDSWGEKLNDNWDDLDATLGNIVDGTTAIAPNLTEGSWEVGGVAVTSTAAELNLLDGVTASTAEINILDGVTATTAELNILDGVTATASEINLLGGKSLSGLDADLITGTAGANGDIVQWNADGDIVSYGAATQLQATWEAGTGTTESLISPAKVKAAIDAFALTIGVDQTWQNVLASRSGGGTSYQNTTGKPIMVSIACFFSGEAIEVSTDNSTWVAISNQISDRGHPDVQQFIVPNGHYYRCNATSISVWAELR